MTSTCNAPSCATASSNVAERTLNPRYAVTSNDQAYVVRVELPGVAKDAVKIDADKGVLTLQAARKNAVPETWKALHRELNDLGYTLRLKLNTQVDEDKLSAQFADGVLTLTWPVREAAKPRRIEVN